MPASAFVPAIMARMAERVTSLLAAAPGVDPGDGSPLPVFGFGVQLDEDFVARLLERRVTAEPATLAGYEARRLERLEWAVLVPQPDGAVEGRLYRGLTATDLDRLDAFQGVGEGLYRRVSVEVTAGHGREPAAAYLPTGRTLARFG